MNVARRLLLNTYYHVSCPWRVVAGRRRAARGQEPVQVLFYHRVADEHPNPWTISTRQFAAQVDWLRRHFDIVSLAEAQRRIASGQNERPTAVLTFDDGYADNCDFALPLLLDLQLPFVYFVTTNHVREGLPFPHDVERGVPLAPNSVADLQALAEAGIELGAHTRTHVDLATVDKQRLEEEIVGSKLDLEAMTGTEVRYFAFPFGQPQNIPPEGFQIARAAGFAGVASAYGGYNFPGRDPFHLERIHGDPEFARLRRWLSVDPWKARRTAAVSVPVGEPAAVERSANPAAIGMAERV